MKHAYFLYTGFGKTKFVLDKLVKASRMPRVLLISTTKIIESSWQAEIDKWYPGQISYSYITGSIKEANRMDIINNQTDIFGLNVEMLDWYIRNTTSIKSKRHTKEGIKFSYNTDEIAKRFDVLVIDETSLFKNSQSERFKHLKKWASTVTNVILLSATPFPKDIENVWSQIYLIDGGERLGSNITAFRNEYANVIPMSNGRNRYEYTREAMDVILEKIKDITTSIPKPAQPLFPEPIIKKLIIKTDPQTTQLLEQFKQDYILKLPNGGNLLAFSKNQLMLKVSQIASGDVYYKDSVEHFNDLKFKMLQHKLSTITTPVLITYVYKFDKDKLLTLPGARLLDKPKDFEDWNANRIPIGILSPFSSAHGLNLQDSDCVDIIWFSPIWDTEKWIQTNARVCRRGQRNVVKIIVLLLKGSFDEYAFDLCIDKFQVQFTNLLKLS